MYRSIGLGLCAAFLFSSTFILNRKMANEGDHWLWSAVLRYLFLAIILMGYIVLRHGLATLVKVFRCYRRYQGFWTIAGCIGFGFYAPLCYAGSNAPAWIIASTWQCTLLATPFILYIFGKPIPKKNVALLVLIALGAVIVNMSHAGKTSLQEILYSAPFVLLAAIGYPFGNQMLKEATKGTTRWVPHIRDPVLQLPSAAVLLMTFGSMPLWIVLMLIFKPYAPSWGQAGQTLLVALISGAFGTSLFLYARGHAKSSSETAAVDATQGGEAIFTLIGEILILGAVWPGFLGTGGLIIICVGLLLYAKQE